MKLGNVGSGRKWDANFHVMARLLIILRDSFANFRRRDAHDWIGRSVVVGASSENLHPKSSFLHRIGLARKRVLDNVAQEDGEAAAVAEERGLQQALDLFLDSGLLDLRKASRIGCRRIKLHGGSRRSFSEDRPDYTTIQIG